MNKRTRELPPASTRNGLVQRLGSYCNVLRDDGLSYGDYLEQLTFLLFLKMADEQTRPPFSRPAFVPAGLEWPAGLAQRPLPEVAQGRPVGVADGDPAEREQPSVLDLAALVEEEEAHAPIIAGAEAASQAAADLPGAMRIR